MANNPITEAVGAVHNALNSAGQATGLALLADPLWSIQESLGGVGTQAVLANLWNSIFPNSFIEPSYGRCPGVYYIIDYSVTLSHLPQNQWIDGRTACVGGFSGLVIGGGGFRLDLRRADGSLALVETSSFGQYTQARIIGVSRSDGKPLNDCPVPPPSYPPVPPANHSFNGVNFSVPIVINNVSFNTDVGGVNVSFSLGGLNLNFTFKGGGGGGGMPAFEPFDSGGGGFSESDREAVEGLATDLSAVIARLDKLEKCGTKIRCEEGVIGFELRSSLGEKNRATSILDGNAGERLFVPELGTVALEFTKGNGAKIETVDIPIRKLTQFVPLPPLSGLATCRVYGLRGDANVTIVGVNGLKPILADKESCE